MLERLSTEEFIARSKEFHGDKYDYSLVEYTKNNVKVKIICPEHGVFEQRPCNHMVGMGCKKCACKDVGGRKKKKASESILQRLYALHGDKYTYENLVYKGSNEKITVTCKVHGDFETAAGNFLHKTNPPGCPSCYAESRRTTKDEFISVANTFHNGAYDYSEVEYVDWETPVTIICGQHGRFTQPPHNHSRYGCPLCAVRGYKTNKPGKLYVLELDNITKIGITNRDVKKRVTQIKSNSGKVFNVTTFFEFEDGAIPKRLESQLLAEMRQEYLQPQESFDGSTESFIDVDVEKLLKRIRHLAQEVTP